MTNQELYEKMRKELPHYQIGFHQISLQKYQEVMHRDSPIRAMDFKIDGENVDEKAIANRIMQKGLQIWDRRLGLSTTTSFSREFLPSELNYKYYLKSGYVYNMIFAIPYFLTYENKDYFIGNLSMSSLNIGSRFIFNESIPSEFVYGYYGKETPFGLSSTCQQFLEDLDFYPNDRFWETLTVEEQKKVLQRIFADQKKDRVLRLANNHSQFSLLRQDEFTRFIVRQTRKQKKSYVKSLKLGHI